MFITIRLRTIVRGLCLFMAVVFLLTTAGQLRGKQASAPVYSPARVLILDAGHGGLDGGAVGADGTIESSVNLGITIKLRDLALLLGQKVVMTRSGEDIAYPDESASIAAKKAADQKARVALIGEYTNAELISIHQNFYPAPSVRGAQVFYRSTRESQMLAETIQERLNSCLMQEKRRVAAPIADTIYLMKNVDCPAVLVECGFLSNPDECALLADEKYQTKLAMTIFSAWLDSRGEQR
jgi:N-acetylmuramoyl-L-alanine amidase